MITDNKKRVNTRPVFHSTANVAFPYSDYADWQLNVLKPWLERNRKGDI